MPSRQDLDLRTDFPYGPVQGGLEVDVLQTVVDAPVFSFALLHRALGVPALGDVGADAAVAFERAGAIEDRKSTRLNSSHT